MKIYRLCKFFMIFTLFKKNIPYKILCLLKYQLFQWTKYFSPIFLRPYHDPDPGPYCKKPGSGSVKNVSGSETLILTENRDGRYLNADHPEVGHPHTDGPPVPAAALLGRLLDGVDADNCHAVAGHRCLTLRPSRKEEQVNLIKFYINISWKKKCAQPTRRVPVGTVGIYKTRVQFLSLS